MVWTNCALLLAEATVYFTVMAALFRARRRVGLGLFICALGAMHFVETYLASVFYVALPFGVISPGSTVLFSGKLMMLLLLYIREDAAAVRQPIYGLLVGNFLMIALAVILRQHEVVPVGAGRLPDLAFIDEMGVLMAWGTTLLFVDAIAIILIYERLGRRFDASPFLRIAIASSCVLTFDQVGFYAALYFIVNAPFTVFLGGWFAKIAAAGVYSLMIVFYIKRFERPSLRAAAPLGDIFDALTYRERYEALVEQSGRDGLTKLQHRGRFDQVGREMFNEFRRSGRSLTLLVIDVDHFKTINDRFGHPVGDQVLQELAQLLRQCAGPGDQIFRIGGEEFAILSHAPRSVVRLLGETIRANAKGLESSTICVVTISAGLAGASAATRSIADLFALADQRLYLAKAHGRDRVHAGVEGEDADAPSVASSAGGG